jgi:small nuclear ribonucleoprotein (snRNP)-like protein
MINELIGKNVVVDLRSTFLCIGELHRIDDQYLELLNADIHDLRDTQTTRENYVIDSRLTGIKRNRKKVFVVRGEVVALAALEDVVES